MEENIKIRQKEVLTEARKMGKETVADIVYGKNPEGIKTYGRDFFSSVSSKSREMTKIYKRKRMDDDVKLIQLMDLRLKIKEIIREYGDKK